MTDKVHTPTRRRRTALILAAVGLVGIGGAVGAVVVDQTRPSVTMAPATPVAIRTLSEGIVTVRGRVVETYGHHFILADASGRALVDTGPEGDDAKVAAGQPVTVQGRFNDGVVHAAFLVGADGKVHALGPLNGPRHGPGRGKRGPGPDRGPDRDAPPPPAASAPAAAAPATAPTPAA